MLEIILLVTLVIGLGGVAFILAKKMPVLAQMPEVHEGARKQHVLGFVKVFYKEKIKPSLPDRMILLKMLSKVRVYVLKIEKQIDNWLQKTRKKFIAEKQQEKKDEEKKNTPM